MRTLPGWEIKIDEISNGVFKVMLTDAFGHKAEVIDSATNETIEKARSYAFDIEKQVSKNWSKFLYEFCLLECATKPIIDKNYNEKSFGSWFITLENKRIVYDGRDFWMYFQIQKAGDWIDQKYFTKSELTYSNFIELVNQLTN